MSNYINTRDLYKRQIELQEELDALNEACGALDELSEWKTDNQEELDELNRLENEIGGEWMHGETLIGESKWEEYCEEFCRDIGAIGENSDFIVIDWEATADNIAQDYSQVDYQGSTYYFRNI